MQPTSQPPTDMQPTPEMLIQALFGCSVAAFVDRVRVNKDGEFNQLYNKRRKAKAHQKRAERR